MRARGPGRGARAPSIESLVIHRESKEGLAPLFAFAQQHLKLVLLAYWEKREREARFLDPLGALPLSAVGEAGERIFGEEMGQ